MYGQTSFNASKNNAAPKGLTALLLGLIICYQVVNQIFLHNAVSHEDSDLESDAACTAAAGPSGYSCMEAKLFQGWHELPAESHEELDQLLKVSPPKDATAPPSEAPAAAVAGAPSGLRGDAKPEVQQDSAAQPTELKPEALEGLLWDLAFKMGGGDKTHEAPEKHRKPAPKKNNAFMGKKKAQPAKKKSFAEGLTDLQQKLERKMQAQAKRHAEHRKLRALTVAAREHSPDADIGNRNAFLTPWAHALDDLTHELESQMGAWQKEHAQHAAARKSTKQQAEKKYDPLTPWAHQLDDKMHEIEDHMKVREKERTEHAAAHAAAHEARMKALHGSTGTAVSETKSAFMDEIDSLGRELCQGPERRNRPACAQFLHPHESAEAGQSKAAKDPHEEAKAHIKLWEKHLEQLEQDREHDNAEIQKETVSFLKELCADPARHSYPSCAKYLASTAAPTARLRSTSDKKPASYAHTLKWASVTEEEEKKPHHVDAGSLVMQRHDLRGTHWEGKIPSVACITVLPEGQVTETLMRYFMDNYKLQHYEGDRELVLVYASADKEAARIAHLYADGTTIKAAAARGGDEFPSATAWRYGAWTAHNADLVMRWDFEAFHHPNRVAMQVRAMTLSKRPASLVTMVTAFDNDGKKATVAGGAGPHGSMMGEAAWMRKHWMPLLEEETTLLHGLHSSDVVQVAMPELLAYHDVSMLGVAPPNPAGTGA